MFKEYSAWQWLLIDVANQYGLDKLNFEDRLQWAEENLDHLEDLGTGKHWKEEPLYYKAVAAVRRAQKGFPTGHVVGIDAVCSGMQIMSALTGCKSGAAATGMVDPNNRADAYSQVTEEMSNILGVQQTVERKKVKEAAMTVLYGSKKKPKEIFGEDTPELNAFYRAMYNIAPGACELLQVLLDSWRPFAPSHDWVLPDGFEAKVKVMKKIEKRIEVDELNHATFTYEYYENEGRESGLSNAANLVHSCDSLVLRSLIRRCSYDAEEVQGAANLLKEELFERALATTEEVGALPPNHPLNKYLVRYAASGFVDPVVIPHLDRESVKAMSRKMIRQLHNILVRMLEHKPFSVIPVHDQFGAHPNNINRVRYWYKEILAEIAESTVLEDLLSQVYGKYIPVRKRDPHLAKDIRNSNYALC